MKLRHNCSSVQIDTEQLSTSAPVEVIAADNQQAAHEYMKKYSDAFPTADKMEQAGKQEWERNSSDDSAVAGRKAATPATPKNQVLQAKKRGKRGKARKHP